MSEDVYKSLENLLIRIEKKLDDQISKQEKDHDKVVILETQMKDTKSDIERLFSKNRLLDSQLRTIALKVAGVCGGAGGVVVLANKFLGS